MIPGNAGTSPTLTDVTLDVDPAVPVFTLPPVKKIVMITYPFDWLIDWLINWLIDWLIDWLMLTFLNMWIFIMKTN